MAGGTPTTILVDANSAPTGGQNESSLAPSTFSAVSNLLKSNGDDKYYQLSNTYDTTSILAATDGPAGNGITVNGTDSIFNPFYVFRYAKFGDIDGTKTYDASKHRDIKPISKNILTGDSTSDTVTQISKSKKVTNNPSASQIIDWARSNTDNSSTTTVGPYPYQWNDFLWCKLYGKIPNNRMITLRRYPIPVEDNLQITNEKMPLVPIAQAVTWWGGESENKLNNVLGMTYGFRWTDKTATVEDVTGNEIEASKLLDALGLTQDKNSVVRKVLLSTFFQNNQNPYAGTGLDDKLQEWVKNSYTNGAYWNRVLGPVNVIDSTKIRNRGFDFNHSITLKFAYKLRTFNNINPKIAMLDLITNFLALTHNKAEFWGGGIRYFQKTGYLLPGINSQKFEQGDFIGGIAETLKSLIIEIQGKAADLSKGLTDVAQGGFTQENLAKAVNGVAQSRTAQNLAGAWVRDLIQKPLTMRSFLDGRAVGEWHVTVGNPMDPIAVIGNLCLKETKIEFSESLGLDDFPTEVTFTVTLQPGRSRAKQDIESMFNLGAGDMSFTALPLPSSAYNSYGERNSIIEKRINNGQVAADPNGKDGIKASFVSTSQNVYGVGSGSSSLADANNLANYFRTNVGKAYGSRFAQSQVLPDYFRQLKTKD